MKKTDLEKIKGSFQIYSNNEYVVLSGTKLYILKKDGSLVACRKDLRYARRITFLSGNRMLLCCGKLIFHMIDLRDGHDLWTIPHSKDEFNLAPLTVTPDGTLAYTYDTWKGALRITRLDLQTQEIDSYSIPYDIGATNDILCNKYGIPCLLKTLYETIGGKTYCQNGVRIQDYDILYRGSSTYWESKWQFEGKQRAFRFLGSTDRIITNDLKIYEPSSGTIFDLLEKEVTWKRPEFGPSDCWLDSGSHYLCLKYQTVNMVIDIQERKVAAQYAGDCTKGCLIDGKYWICNNGRILQKPFPAFEAAPPIQTGTSGWGLDYSKFPELW